MILENKKTIIITLLLDETSQQFFEEKRKTFFPTHANFTTAHLTLFHCLPNNAFIFEKVKAITKNTNTFKMQATGILHQKKFNAYEITSDKLLELHKILQNDFIKMLSKKDVKPLKPHITIQNKTTVYKAQKTNQLLVENFIAFETQAIGISCWYFTKNKWKKKEDYFFNN